MSAEYKGQDPLEIAKQAEADLNSHAAKHGHDANISSGHGKGASDSTLESGVDANVEKKFPGAEVTYGSAASGAGDNREIPESEGGDAVNPATGGPTKARDFEGLGGPEDKLQAHAEAHGGDDDVRGNIRQEGKMDSTK
ncbi:hypothetical protein W97_02477 [Coniosporium apollinis CBS 100218]|uniref:Uncharacterized protein n=1 Tax=Coniosporium apollinis (strain CBS 100218) TaxID=1168221 RepID=R7YMT9_CONA1|nr:uncharacterized protein W97_02477 [Coniosporium apollinis CBS 100218]EON63250.1 hypothetical protein W97_02477 [Coniosporium apollinis CBS 100218]